MWPWRGVPESLAFYVFSGMAVGVVALVLLIVGAAVLVPVLE